MKYRTDFTLRLLIIWVMAMMLWVWLASCAPSSKAKIGYLQSGYLVRMEPVWRWVGHNVEVKAYTLYWLSAEGDTISTWSRDSLPLGTHSNTLISYR